MAGGLTRGEVRLVRFPPPDEERPVLILTRQSTLPALRRVTVAPITSTIREVDSEVVLTDEDGMRQPCAVNLHNLVTIPQALVGRHVATLSPARMRQVCRAVGFALGCWD